MAHLFEVLLSDVFQNDRREISPTKPRWLSVGQPGVLNEGYLHRDGPRRGFNARSRPKSASPQARSTPSQARCDAGRVATVCRGRYGVRTLGCTTASAAHSRGTTLGGRLCGDGRSSCRGEWRTRVACASRHHACDSDDNPRAVSKSNLPHDANPPRHRAFDGLHRHGLRPSRSRSTSTSPAVKYLAGAYRVAGGSEGGAVANYARGYYHQAKRQNLSPYGAPASAAFAMQTSPRDVRAHRRDFKTPADQHTLF